MVDCLVISNKMKTILFTGANGFVGENVIPILKEKGFIVKTLGLINCDYNVNITKEFCLQENFDIVFHAAGKAHTLPRTEEEKQAFYDINFEGTKNLCKALEQLDNLPKSFIFMSTVAVYGCEVGVDINENHPLNGITPYAKSKILAEDFLINWSKKYNVKLSIIRPSLIAGRDAPGNLGAMVNGIKTGKYLSIAGGKARKSVLMVEDIAFLVPKLIEKNGIYNVCDDSQPSFRELEALIAKQLNKKLPLSIPMWIAELLAKIGNLIGRKAPINSDKLKKIIQTLTFSNDKIKKDIGWQPIDVIKNYEI